MRTSLVQSGMKGLIWTGVVVLFVVSSLVIASCQEKQEISQSRAESVRVPLAVEPGISADRITATMAALSSSPSDLRAGQPPSSAESQNTESGPPETESPEPSETVRYEVVAGDNLWDISLSFYTTHVYWRLLAEWNEIDDPAALRPGRVLKIPPVTEFPYQLYLVREGDNLTSISRMFYSSGDLWETLAGANELASADRISAGMILKIPKIETSGEAGEDSTRLASGEPAQ